MSMDAKWYANWIRLLPASSADEKMRNLEAADLLEQLETQVPRWIPVEERLPEECLYVIVYLRGRHTYNEDIWHMDADYFEDGDWHRYTESGHYEVTHWMPLPEAPKEDAHAAD